MDPANELAPVKRTNCTDKAARTCGERSRSATTAPEPTNPRPLEEEGRAVPPAVWWVIRVWWEVWHLHHYARTRHGVLLRP